MAISWTLKSTTATSFTMGNNWGSLPGDAPLLPFLMNINSEKMAGKIGGKVWVSCTESSLKSAQSQLWQTIRHRHEATFYIPLLKLLLSDKGTGQIKHGKHTAYCIWSFRALMVSQHWENKECQNHLDKGTNGSSPPTFPFTRHAVCWKTFNYV